MSEQILTAVASDYGDPADVVRVERTAGPAPAAGELLIRVSFASVNPVDWKVLEGGERKLFDLDFPFHPGCDGSGEVAAVGDGAGGFAVGDRVAFNSPLPRVRGDGGGRGGRPPTPAPKCRTRST